MSLFLKFNLILILVFAVALLPAGYISNSLLQKNARTQIVPIARIMMQSALATRGYTNKQIQPLLAPRLADEFLPQSVPSYSATEIFNNLRESNPEYTYKEAALNPTNPRDRTVEWEADVVNAFRANEKLPEIIGERDAPLGRALYPARPIKITDAGCLSCHTTPDVAPASVVKVYVPSGLANTAFKTLLGSLIAVFASILVVLNVLLMLVIIRPIKRLSEMADQVSTGNLDVPDVTVKGTDEVAVLSGSFNRMRISLTKALKMLESE